MYKLIIVLILLCLYYWLLLYLSSRNKLDGATSSRASLHLHVLFLALSVLQNLFVTGWEGFYWLCMLAFLLTTIFARKIDQFFSHWSKLMKIHEK